MEGPHTSGSNQLSNVQLKTASVLGRVCFRFNRERRMEGSERIMFKFTVKIEGHKVIHTACLTENTIDGEKCGKPNFVENYVLFNDNCRLILDDD